MKIRTIEEYRVRGSQEATKALERLFGFRCAELSNDQLRREFRGGHPSLSMDQLIASMMRRLAMSDCPLFPSWKLRSDIPALMTVRFPDATKEIIERANRVCDFQFDLLGFTGLQFGCPINWHLEPVSGRSAPVTHWSQVAYLDPQVAGDKKITWELNRHQFFVTLGQAYCLTGDERYTEAFMAQVWSWMDANPPKQGIAWASSLELALRVISWVWALHLFASSSRVSVPVVQRMLKFLIAQGRHIETYLSHYFSPNTHLTGEALGLVYLGSALPELQIAEKWKSLGLKILLQQLPKHVHKDGVYFEQSTYYHRYTTDIYLHLYLLAKVQGILLPAVVKDRLMLLLEHLMWITRPDGTSPYVGDDDGGILVPFGIRSRNDFRATLALGATLFRQPTWKYVAGDECHELLWMLGARGLNTYDSLDDELPRETTKSFEEGGYFVLRNGWSPKASYVMVDCGPHGAMNCGHAHADALSFEYSSGGTSWIVDPGTYTYTGNVEQRNHFRSTLAHNTITVDDLSQSIPSGPFSWSTIGSSQGGSLTQTAQWVRFTGQHDGYRRLADPVTHIRTLGFMKTDSREPGVGSYVVIHDRLVAAETHHYASRLHFSPACRAIQGTAGAVVSTETGQELLVVTVVWDSRGLVTTVRTKIESGEVSPCYGLRLDAPVFVSAWEATGACSGTTVLVPLGEMEPRVLLDQVINEIGNAEELLNVPHDVVQALDDAFRATLVQLSAEDAGSPRSVGQASSAHMYEESAGSHPE